MNDRTGIIRSVPYFQPSFRLVDLFEERIDSRRSWNLPFNLITLCQEEDPRNPSFVELPEKDLRIEFEKGLISFTTCNTPLTLFFTPANRHCCIHFNYELMPGVDLFSGIRERFAFHDPELAREIGAIFAEPDLLRRTARAEAAAMKFVLRFWPERMPLDLLRMAKFRKLLDFVRGNLERHPGIPEMAASMGWSEAYFSRAFREVFHITPMQYVRRELFIRSLDLLNDPSKSIKEIAAELGFSSEFNFSRFIKQCSKLSPSELRKGERRLPLYVRK